MERTIQLSPGSGTTPAKLCFTRFEAAHLLNISPNSLDRLVKRRLIKPSRALRRPLFALEELQRFLAETT
jgi:hypothetical protein